MGSNPASFDTFFSTSYTQNLVSNWDKLNLTIETVTLDASVLLPSSLQMKRNIQAEVIEKSGAIRQVLASDTLTDVQSLAVGFHIKVYDRNVKGSKGTDGLYAIPSAAVPITEAIMRTPNGAAFTDTIEYVIIDRKNAGGTRVQVVRHSATTDTHTKSTYAGSLDASGNPVVGGLLETDQISYSNRGTKPYDYTLTREVKRITTTAGGPQYGTLKLVSRRLEEYRDLTPSQEGGQSSYKRCVREIDGYGSSDERETRYAFYDDPSNLMIHGRLKQVRKPDGNWEYYTYTDYEGSAVFEQTKYSAWCDTLLLYAPDGPPLRLEDAKKEVTSVASTTSFTKVTTHGGVSTGSEAFSSIPQADGSLLNTLVNKSGSGESVRKWLLYSSTAADYLAGRIAWMENPDGTAETYTYTATTNGGFRLVHRKGAGNRNGVTAGTETTTEYNSFVEASSESVKDIASGLLVSFWIAPSVDILGRPTRIEYNGNENDYETFEYSCCGLARKRNRDASVTTWTRDPLKRVYLRNDYRFAADSAPLITSNVFDGLVESSTRGGILQNEITRLLNGDTASVKSPDQDNDGTPETTTIAYSSGGRITTTTYPDGGTEIRENYRDGQLKSITGTAVADRSFTYGAYIGGLWKQETKLTATGGTDEWTKTYTDALGHTVKTERPYGASLATATITYYDTTAAAGSRTKLASQTEADGKTTTFAYNAEGEKTTVTEQMPAGQSLVTAMAHDVVNDTALGVSHRETTTVNGIVTNVSTQSGDGHSSRRASLGRVTATIKTVADAAGNAIVTTTNPDGTQEVRTITGNLVTQVATKNTLGNTLLAKSYTYDALRRVASITDTRTGITTINGYNGAGQVMYLTDSENRTTIFEYDGMGRKVMVDAPDTQDASGATLANITYTSYYPTGLEKATWGDQTYPVYKGYDEQGRMNELRTYRTLAHGTMPTADTGGFDLTSWTYNSLGLLANKRYADNQGPTYTYTPGGKLATRTWARGVTTSYSYDKGLLTGTDYSDATPDVAVAYDAFGRQTSVTQTNQSRIDYTYDPATLALDTESIAYDLDHDGTADFTRVLDRSRDSLQRDTGWQLKNGGTVENEVSYAYSATTGRLESVTGSGRTFSYSYALGSTLLASVTGPAHTVTNIWAPDRDVLLTKENKVGSTVISRFEYGVNALGQRTNVATSGTAFSGTPTWDWGYNARGEVTQADSSVTAFDRAYEYDGIGNRKKSADSLTLPSEDNYTANALNQYSSLQLNPQSAIANPQYDPDGNATACPLPAAPTTNSTLAWDGENRLIETQVGTSGPHVRYLYDAQSRRIAKITGDVSELTVYDAWNPIAEYTRSTGVPPVLSQAYTWGTDLSGTIQGAGGVGGLLSLAINNQPSTLNFFPTYDGNGNVSEYLDSTCATAVHFEYDAFGCMIASTGNASDFRIRFSTKKEDPEAGLNYYGYRYSDLLSGSWISRDVIEEIGGENVYAFCRNSPLSTTDFLGKNPQPGPYHDDNTRPNRGDFNSNGNRPVSPNDQIGPSNDVSNASANLAGEINDWVRRINNEQEHNRAESDCRSKASGATKECPKCCVTHGGVDEYDMYRFYSSDVVDGKCDKKTREDQENNYNKQSHIGPVATSVMGFIDLP